MDYTESSNFATHAGTGNRMHEADQPFPTVVSDSDVNALIWELIEVIKDASILPQGFDPDVPETYQQVRDAIRAMGPELPLTALPFPTIGTSDKRLPVTAAAAANGGVVSIVAGIPIALGEEVSSGVSGRLRGFLTQEYQSPDLDVSSTYYLRAQVINGVLTIYKQKGADSDGMPVSLIGSPDGSSGGGFDSTVLDVLLARVVTGAAGSAPTVTRLANAAVLRVTGRTSIWAQYVTTTDLFAEDVTPVGSYSLDWARTPYPYVIGWGGLNMDAPAASGSPDVAYGLSADRYTLYVHLSRGLSDVFNLTWGATA